jgi:superfamily I DNA/RNA helicase
MRWNVIQKMQELVMLQGSGLHGTQLKAAARRGTPPRLPAGPGSRKTVTLTRRVVKPVAKDRISPRRILAVAFARINA